MLGNHTVDVEEPLLGRTSRRYVVAAAPSRAEPAPLLLAFHGQSSSPEKWKQTEYFQALAEVRGWAMVLPAGIEEAGDSKENDTGWNCGTAGDNSTCVEGTEGSNCMYSCSRLGRCGRCNWSTCHDDVLFIQRMLAQLEEDLCLDQTQYYLVGESNGAMFIHYLIQQLPGRFIAAAPVFGSPLLGYLVGSEYQLVQQQDVARRTSVLQLHGRSDVTIPWQGGRSKDGWLYEARERSLGVWAALHGCAREPQPQRTPYSGGPTNVSCFEYEACSAGGHVMRCDYDGGHGDWPGQPLAAELIFSFFRHPAHAEGELATLMV